MERGERPEIVIYASVDSYSASQGYTPVVGMRIKVIDVTNDKRLWPPEEEKQGVLILTKAEAQQGFEGKTPSEVVKAENSIADRAGLALAHVFYEHEAAQSVYQISR